MAYLVTRLPLPPGNWTDICPQACLVRGESEEEGCWFYIDPCLDCHECLVEDGHKTIFPNGKKEPPQRKAPRSLWLNTTPLLSQGHSFAGE